MRKQSIHTKERQNVEMKSWKSWEREAVRNHIIVDVYDITFQNNKKNNLSITTYFF